MPGFMPFLVTEPNIIYAGFQGARTASRDLIMSRTERCTLLLRFFG